VEHLVTDWVAFGYLDGSAGDPVTAFLKQHTGGHAVRSG